MAPTERDFTEGRVRANGVDFAYLEAGSGPLALCLHGFPDSAWGWRRQLPALADAGFRAVAPFLRGYHPTALPPDGRYQTGALVADAVALHEELGGDGDAVILGHDWGAVAAYGAASYAEDRWRRVVAMAVPPSQALAAGFLSYDQLKRSWYMFFFQSAMADMAVAMDDLAFIDRLWADWSPGYDASEDLPRVKEALRPKGHLQAALGYYRAQFGTTPHDPELAEFQRAAGSAPPLSTLYLHGRDDGCVGVALGEQAGQALAEGSRVALVDDAGHFLHLERPDEVNHLVLEFLGN